MILRPLTLFAAAAGVAAYLYLKKDRGHAHAPAPEASGEPLPDHELEARVREALAGRVADPGALHITVQQGTVSLRGAVLPGERDGALAAVLGVPGVMQVKNLLEPVEPVEPLAT